MTVEQGAPAMHDALASRRPGTEVAAELRALFAQHIADPRTGWSVGTFGAVAEFRRDPDEPADLRIDDDHWSVVTGRGAIGLTRVAGLRAFAYESARDQAGDWNHAVALCLPSASAVMNQRGTLTGLGTDADALRAQDRNGALFDMGLGCRQVDVCVRSDAPEVLAALRVGVGRSLLDAQNPLMGEMPRLSPHRVFVTRFARGEVFQRVPPAHGVSPSGPHTHVLPGMMREARTHAATAPIPEGWIPCAHLFPAHPAHDSEDRPQPFDARAHDAFQNLLRQFGDPALWALKQRVLHALDTGRGLANVAKSLTRHERAVVRVTLRQWSRAQSAPGLPARWLEAFDAPGAETKADRASIGLE